MTYFRICVAVLFTSFLFHPNAILCKTKPVICPTCHVCELFRLKENIAWIINEQMSEIIKLIIKQKNQYSERSSTQMWTGKQYGNFSRHSDLLSYQNKLFLCNNVMELLINDTHWWNNEVWRRLIRTTWDENKQLKNMDELNRLLSWRAREWSPTAPLRSIRF